MMAKDNPKPEEVSLKSDHDGENNEGKGNIQSPKEPKGEQIGQIIFSCVVTWLCCLCLGVAGFVCAVKSCCTADQAKKGKMLKKALKINIAGLVVGIIVWIIYIAGNVYLRQKYEHE